jgi:S-adenosylmethionine hydrolase
MKGAVLSVNSSVLLLDLCHSLPPQDLRACSFFLRACLPYFPAGTIHVIVVDPGVGTDRALLYVEAGTQRLLVPDNGCWTEAARRVGGRPSVVTLTERRYWRADVTPTFHGRDILAPVAGHLSLGVQLDQLGPPASRWVDINLPVAHITANLLEGEVLFVDDFGNLITNLPGDVFLNRRDPVGDVVVGGHLVRRQVRTYSDAPLGELVVLVSSLGTVEIAEVQGSAARRLRATAGTPIRVPLRLPDPT